MPNANTTNVFEIAKAILKLAEKHLNNGADMASSANLCYKEAVELFANEGDHEQAAHRAIQSMAYSVGILHDDYKKALRLWSELKYGNDPVLPSAPFGQEKTPREYRERARWEREMAEKVKNLAAAHLRTAKAYESAISQLGPE